MLGPRRADDVDPVVLRTVQSGVFAGRRLRLHYATRSAEPRWRTVDPVGLVDADGQWYLLATHDGADRTYRMSRVRAAELLAEPAAPVGDVDLAALWEGRQAGFRSTLPKLTARVRLRVPLPPPAQVLGVRCSSACTS